MPGVPVETELRSLRALYDLMRRANLAARPEDVYEAALDALHLALGVRRASILLFDAAGVMRFVAWRGLSERYRAAVDGHSPWSRDHRDPVPIVVGDARAEASLASYGDLFEKESVRCLAFVPLVDEGRIVGKFMLYSESADAFGAEDVRLAESIAGHVAHALERKRAAVQLTEQNERHAALLAAVSDLGDAIVVAEGPRPLWANEAYARLFGWTLEEVLAPGFNILDRVDPAAREEFAARIQALASGERQSDHYEVDVMRRDGTPRRVEVSVKAFGAAPTHRRVAILRDVTERQRAQSELMAARSELAQSEKLSALGQLVSGVAHELRTPLTYLTTSLHLADRRMAAALERLPAPQALEAREEVRPHMASALDAAERIDRLVEDLRRYTRLKSGARTPVSLAESVRGAVSLFQATRRSEVVVESKVEPTQPLPLDAVQVQQVVLNLLENALDARPADGHVRVRVRAIPGGGSVLEVEDRGEGIPSEVQARMWDPFFTTKPHGTGLGLSIVRRIVEEHGATIECESRVGEGTRFVVRFPPPSRAVQPGPVPAV